MTGHGYMHIFKLNTMMKVDKETIYHFTCQECKGWFSIATMEDWKPKKLYCPHCGKFVVFEDK